MFFNYLSICTYKHLQVKLLYSLLSFILFNFFLWVLESFCFNKHNSWSPSWRLSSLFYASPSMLVVPSLLFLYTTHVCFPSSMSIPFYSSMPYIDDCRPFFMPLRLSLRISSPCYCVLLYSLAPSNDGYCSFFAPHVPSLIIISSLCPYLLDDFHPYSFVFIFIRRSKISKERQKDNKIMKIKINH